MAEVSTNAPPRIVSLTGGGRSGSTVLGNVLAQAPGYVHVGEICYLWNRGVRLNALCGCGAPFDACPLWTQVMSDPDVARFLPSLRRLERFPRAANRRLPLLMVHPMLARGAARDAELYAEQLSALYAAIHRASGGATIIDSSKTPSHMHVLARLPGIDLRVVHLVRDPRAVSHSWNRKVTRTDLGGRRSREMTRTSIARGALKWLYSNALIDASLRGLERGRLLRLRYEDVVEDPVAGMRRIGAHAGRPDAAVPIAADGSIELAATHTVWGNPNRLAVGETRLRADDAWRRAMPTGDRLVVTAVTWPLLVRYGYALRG